MKVLVSAWACEPGRGSENEVGFRTVMAAATRHEVWVITNPSAVAGLRRALEGTDVADRIHLQALEFVVTGDKFEHLGMVGFQRYYGAWQRQAGRVAAELDSRVGFDVVHHATLSSYWTRAGVASVNKPLVWGPVGGGVNPPRVLMAELGFRGILEDVARTLSRPVLACLPSVRRAQRSARVVFAQNLETAARLRTKSEIRVLSNALATSVPAPSSSRNRSKEIFLVGRLLPWKLPTMAIRALASMESGDAVLRIFGDGPERTRVERLARSLGVIDRVVFEGWLSRPQLLDRLSRAGVLIHPSLHEEAGMCIAESLSLGTPVVTLQRGGPAQIAQQWPSHLSVCVPPANRKEIAKRFASAMDDFLVTPPPIPEAPVPARTSFEAEILDAYNVAAGERPVSGKRTHFAS